MPCTLKTGFACARVYVSSWPLLGLPQQAGLMAEQHALLGPAAVHTLQVCA
jgi:hypothetical protein